MHQLVILFYARLHNMFVRIDGYEELRKKRNPRDALHFK